jgi:hypothetical protein
MIKPDTLPGVYSISNSCATSFCSGRFVLIVDIDGFARFFAEKIQGIFIPSPAPEPSVWPKWTTWLGLVSVAEGFGDAEKTARRRRLFRVKIGPACG